MSNLTRNQGAASALFMFQRWSNHGYLIASGSAYTGLGRGNQRYAVGHVSTTAPGAIAFQGRRCAHVDARG